MSALARVNQGGTTMKRVPVSIRRVPFMIPRWAASMVPARRTILVRQGVLLSVPLLAHELCHVTQAETRAWPLAYFAQWVASGFSYHRMPFEVEARGAEVDPFYRAWARALIEEGWNQ